MQVPVSQGSSDQFAFLSRNGMIRSEEGNRASELIKSTFLKGMGLFGNDTNLVAIHKNANFGPTGQLARFKRFEIFSAAVAEKCGGNATIKHACNSDARYGPPASVEPTECKIVQLFQPMDL
ncbi:hypothetical protein Vadar_027585 [Vaccinium darrowii]|uniref:Uncharacterized protein n=1 Tax=Vaccinium darrowii TaxID=229202 RepID=A0ACB7YYN6_9ERIC|nr:hypothetical protein Vadar_027585 [Vaccinium darrowii]